MMLYRYRDLLHDSDFVPATAASERYADMLQKLIILTSNVVWLMNTCWNV